MGTVASKLTDEDVKLIREATRERRRLLAEADTLSQKNLARKFNVSVTTISDVVNYTYTYINNRR